MKTLLLSTIVLCFGLNIYSQKLSTTVDADGNLSVRNVDGKPGDTLKAKFKVEYEDDTFYKEVLIIGDQFCQQNFPDDFIRTELDYAKPKHHFLATWSVIVDDETVVMKPILLSFQQKSELQNATNFIDHTLKAETSLTHYLPDSLFQGSIRDVYWYRDAIGFHYLIHSQDEEGDYFNHMVYHSDVRTELLSSHQELKKYCHDPRNNSLPPKIEDLNQDGVNEIIFVLLRECESGEKVKYPLTICMFDNRSVHVYKGKQGKKPKSKGMPFPKSGNRKKGYMDSLWSQMGARQ